MEEEETRAKALQAQTAFSVQLLPTTHLPLEEEEAVADAAVDAGKEEEDRTDRLSQLKIWMPRWRIIRRPQVLPPSSWPAIGCYKNRIL